MTLIILAQARNFFLTLTDEKLKGESVFYRLSGISKLNRFIGYTLLFCLFSFLNIGVYFIFCWMGWGSVEIFENPVKILFLIVFFIASESNYVYFLSKIQWLRNGRHKALQLSNLLILLPNFLVLFFHRFEENKLIGAATFMFPGSALIGLIMQEKSPFIFSVKMFFMLFLSFSYIILLLAYQKIRNFFTRNKKSKFLQNFLSSMISNHSGVMNQKVGVLVPACFLSKFSKEAKELKIKDLRYFPPFSFPPDLCFKEIISVIESTKVINSANFAHFSEYMKALDIEENLLNVRFGKMDPAKLAPFKVLFVLLISRGWVFLHEKILGNSVSDFIDFYSLNNIIVLTADQSKTLFFDHIYQFNEGEGFVVSECIVQTKFLSKTENKNVKNKNAICFLGKYKIKTLEYKHHKNIKEKWFVSQAEYKLFELFKNQSDETVSFLNELGEEPEIHLTKNEVIIRIIKMKFEFLTKSVYLLLTPMVSFFCFVLYFKSINNFQEISNKALLDKEVSIANFYSITNFNLYFVLNMQQFRKYKVNSFFQSLISPQTYWTVNFLFDYGVFVLQNLPRVIYAALTLSYQCLQPNPRISYFCHFHSPLWSDFHNDLLCVL